MNRFIFSLKIKFSAFLILMFLASGQVLTACSSSDLSRSKAQRLITDSPAFKQPDTLSLSHRYEKKPFDLDKASEGETAAAGELRVRQQFLAYNPRIALAVHLDLADVGEQFIRETKSGGWQFPAQWFFNISVYPTGKSEAMWKEYDLPVAENSLPLARKEFLKITGITSPAENQRLAQFTWQWKPNPVGMALQENTPEFKSLPDDLQKGLLGRTEGNTQPETEEWNGERTAQALFEHYDDGWRLVRYW